MAQAPPKKTSPPQSDIGYPLIEKLVETEDFTKINKSFSTCYETLERMLKNKQGGLKRQKLIREALQAYDLTVDLIKELLKVKYQMGKAHEKK